MPSSKDVLSSLNIAPTAQASILLVLIMFALGWWIYSKAIDEFNSINNTYHSLLNDLYGPIRNLILGKIGNRIKEEDFSTRLNDLLIDHGIKANDVIYGLILEWLKGKDNEQELLGAIEKEIQKIRNNKLYEGYFIKNAKVTWWGLKTLFPLFLVGIIVFVTYTILIVCLYKYSDSIIYIEKILIIPVLILAFGSMIVAFLISKKKSNNP